MTAIVPSFLAADAACLRWHTATASGEIAMPHEPFLAWLRSQGIEPEKAKRCEVYEGGGGKPPYAIVTLYEVDGQGRKVFDEVSEEAVTYTDIVTLSSLPPLGEG